jgi:adenine-specific DNA-methyltransferase
MLEDFIDDLKVLYFDILDQKTYLLIDFKEKWNIEGSIGETYQALCKRELKKEMGSFYTPYEVVEFMVKETVEKIDYKNNPFVKILDPSCGGGYFLIYLIDYLKQKAIDAGFHNPVEHIVKNNIYGFDLDLNAVMITSLEIYDKTGFCPQNILLKDFLMEEIDSFDVVIGNPPYMGHKVLTGEYRTSLYRLYKEVFSDKGDISYCFIKKSIDSLKEGGKLIFFTSRYILEALHGRDIRKYIIDSGSIDTIIDFYGVRLVKGAGVDNIIIEFVKGKENSDVNFYRFKNSAKGMGNAVFEDIKKDEQVYTKHVKSDVKHLRDEGWTFLDDVEQSIIDKINGVELSSICESYQGIITGCDDAFVLSKDEAEKLEIEKDIQKPWIKSSNINRFSVLATEEVLIYSNLINDEEKYINAINYIEKHKNRLENRRECKKGVRRWFDLQWGRKESLFEEKKIIFPYKSSSNRFAIDECSFFSADVYAIKIMDMFLGTFSYEFLVGVLNSSIYEFYTKSMAKKLGDNLYEYYPNKIMTLKVPGFIGEIEDEVLRGGDDLRDRIDGILVDYFRITEREYKVIRQWCG